ncbi:SET domain protein, partial [Phlegmacium glaucopus]
SMSLHAWLSETGGGFHPNVSFTGDAFGSRVIASDHLPKDLTIVSCPFGLAITQAAAQRAVLETLGISASENIQWSERQWISTYISLHWILASEDDKAGKKSLVHAIYLDTLPTWEKLRTPLHFTPSELDIYKGTNLYGAALDRDRLWRIEWTACQTFVGRANANWANLFTWSVVLDRYLTAATYLSSRAFPSSLLSPTPSLAHSPTSQPVLLPGVDALNHARGQPISWVVTYPNTNDTSQEPKISLVLHTATLKGDELFNNYGPKPNSELILGYGFSIPHNPDDTIVLKIGGSFEDGKKWEIGRETKGVENMWTDLMRAFIQDSSQNPSYEDMLDASSALQEMVQNFIDRLPAEEIVETTEIRVEVIAMFQDYLEGQRDILRSLMEFAKAQERLALEMAREKGVEIVFDDEEE